jgi:hypothetical protein
MFILHNLRLNTFQTLYEYVIYLIKTVLTRSLPIYHFHIESETLNRHFTSMTVGVFSAVLLYGYIG